MDNRGPLWLSQQAPPPMALPPVRSAEPPPRVDAFERPESAAREAARRRAERYIVERIDPQLSLDLPEQMTTILRLSQPPIRDQVADPSVIDVVNITEREYSITGRTIGKTVLNFWFRNPELPGGEELVSYVVRVTEDPEIARHMEALLEAVERDVNRAFPDSAVSLTYAAGQVVVRGQARDVDEASQILRIVSQSLPDNDQVNRAQLPEEFLLNNVSVEEIERAGGIQGVLRGESATGANGTQINNRIVNLLEVGGLHQVMLKVTVAEVNRSAARAIGADLRIGGSSGVSFFSLLPIAELASPGLGGTLLVDRGDFDLAINALKQLNLARSLAEPNLVTLNGQTANFQVGGEFPVPQITGFTDAGLQGVEFVPFGVQLQFLPIISDRDRIRLNLQATVSTRNESIGTTIGGTGSNVPGLNTRDFQTTVELREGQTLAIAGLIQSNLGASSDRIPFAGDVPFLGRLFSSDNTSYDEQELVVLVTPYLVSPIEAGHELPPLPGSDYFEPDDLEFFLKGSITGHFAEDFRSPARTDMSKIKAYRRLEQELIIGQPGHSNGLLCPPVQTPVLP
ncbi:pilus assembly protein N-terminal domain-containing protein [Maioricimonas sp. JC845]|uniref:type II and III secretion system protein family protein n=1 Tax=Maioricimonas sp. JC845 TaxID=3232138 RepID=UPI0034589A43